MNCKFQNLKHRALWPGFMTLGLILTTSVVHSEPQPLTTAYLLGPQDTVMIRVHSLRRNTGEAYPWVPLSGPFTVAADGTLALPILGRLTVRGETITDLAAEIGTALKDAANLSEEPSVAVEIVTYRPFFIMGAVQQPGKYDYEPGLTVLQAISVAQGFVRSTDIAGTERDIIAAQGGLRTLAAARIGLETKLARLAAEAESQTVLTFPEDLATRDYDPRVTVAMREEQQRFAANRDALDTEMLAIAESQKLLQEELVSLDGKSKALERQFELLSEQVKLSTELRDRGLTPAARQIEAENSRVSVQSILLDVQLSKLRAQQSLSRASRDAVDVRSRYRKTALDDLTETRTLLEQNREMAETARRQLQAATLRGQEAMGSDPGLKPVYRLVRQAASGPQTSVVDDTTLLQPGDVVQVSFVESINDAPAQ